jgi:hypothetical protein
LALQGIEHRALIPARQGLYHWSHAWVLLGFFLIGSAVSALANLRIQSSYFCLLSTWDYRNSAPHPASPWISIRILEPDFHFLQKGLCNFDRDCINIRGQFGENCFLKTTPIFYMSNLWTLYISPLFVFSLISFSNVLEAFSSPVHFALILSDP